ncbi:hypothetical protein LXL04_009211 [Taraxacum kok-saghyz]
MDYVCPVNGVEQQLKVAGEQLALPPSSTKDLLDLLDNTEQLLAFVGQAPNLRMQGALVPSMGALISHDLLKHSDMDVKVSVASCLCEVSRITAPEPPYKDDIMKDIFQLNVQAFGELSNVTGRNYYKAIHILESVAKVKSCLLMLDLECDALILEMFEQFLSRIRTNHPQSVFSDMENIMTLVLEESDEIASQLLSLLISHVRKENQNLSPAPWKLAEKVLRNCYNTLKPYSSTLIELIEADADEYAEIVATLCQNDYENQPPVTKPTPIKANNVHKRDANNNNTLMLSHSKKQKPNETQKSATTNSKKIENQNNNSSKGRPKNKRISASQESRPKLVQDSKEDVRKTRFQDKTLNADKGLGYGKELVGRRIKVWWPLDKMYYEGAVSSYNPIDKKHKVLYADGDEEVLDLRLEKWLTLDNNKSSPHQVTEQASQSPNTTSSKRLKQRGKKKLEFSPMQENNSNSPKSSSLKTKPTKEDDDSKGENISRNEVVEINETNENTSDKMEQDIEPMPTTQLEQEQEKEKEIKIEKLEEIQEKEIDLDLKIV